MKVGLRLRLIGGVVAIFLLAAIALLLFSKTTIEKLLVEKIGKRGHSIAHHFADESVASLLTRDFLGLDLKAREYIRAEEDLVYIFIVDRDGRVNAHSFQDGFPAGLAGANTVPAGSTYSTKSLSTNNGPVLDIAYPVMEGRLGTARIGISEASVTADVREIQTVVFASAAVIFAFAIIAVILFETRETEPIIQLTKLASHLADGDFSQRAAVKGNNEVGELARAFNTMIDARKAHDEERTRLIEELKGALENVRTLSGFLPICSSCKKIRDDKGYWTAVESYVSKHTDAEFTHGYCPDCVEQIKAEYHAEIRRRNGVLS